MARRRPSTDVLIGMRGRIHAVGGELVAGQRPDGGFESAPAYPLAGGMLRV